eukprot:2658307-Karenia_brevis.AAC.1
MTCAIFAWPKYWFEGLAKAHCRRGRAFSFKKMPTVDDGADDEVQDEDDNGNDDDAHDGHDGDGDDDNDDGDE